MNKTGKSHRAGEKQRVLQGSTEFRSQNTMLKTGELQDSIFHSTYFSSIATDEEDVIQIFNVGAE